MNRKHTRQDYFKIIEKLRKARPDIGLSSDFIVGFPGETHEHFLETYNFVNELDVSYLHVFTYSERANTRALNIKPVVPIPDRKERNKMLRILSEKKKRKFYSEHVNTKREVLFEAENDNGIRYGFTDNYIKVGIPYEEEMWNTIQTIKLNTVSDFGYVKGTKHLEFSIA